MNKELWDLPVKKASLKKLKALIDRYRQEGKARELGICLARMSHLVKHVGTDDGTDTFPSSADYGIEAIHWLREAGDKKELARALRVACVPFCDGPHEEWLAESLALSREIGDRENEGWTLYRYTRALSPPHSMVAEWESLEESERIEQYRTFSERAKRGHTVEEAHAVFESISDANGIATCLVSLAVERKPHNRAKFEHAIVLYEEAGEKEKASKARVMMETFAPECNQ